MNRKIALIGDLSYRDGLSISSEVSVIGAFGDRPIIEPMKKVNISYDAVITGYMSDPNEILKVRDYICDLKLDNPNTFVLVDPVFADDGKLYDGITKEHIDSYKKLVEIADLITPNLSEACFLTESSYDDYRDKYVTVKYDSNENNDGLSKKIFESICPLFDTIRIKKNQVSIVTGIEMYNSILTVLDIYDGDHGKRQTTCNYSEKVESRCGPGPGELFNTMYLESCMMGFTMADALSVTTSFINNSLRFSRDQKADINEGIVFEPILCDNVMTIRSKIKQLKEKEKENK